MGSRFASRIRVWDLPTRLFHWLLTAIVIGSVVTVNLGGNWMAWHARFGYAALTLILFRLVWGFVGGRYARFASFVAGPARIVAHLRGAAPGTAGHSPLGSLSVFALLAAIGFQATSGLFAFDEIAFEGPLSRHVSEATALWLTGLHRLNENVIYGLVGLHVAAIAYYRLRHGKRLVGPMITGDQTVAAAAEPSRDDAALRLRGLAVLIGSAAAVAALVYLAG